MKPLSPSLLRRMRARCVVRARRYWQNHPDFRRNDEVYFFFGAMAVLECLRDPAATALVEEWTQDFAANRSPRDQSSEARAARQRDHGARAELAALLRQRDRAELDALLEQRKGAQ